MAALREERSFQFTEPTRGLDSIALETSARRDGDTWVLSGQKKWIGNGIIADVVVVAGTPTTGRSRRSWWEGHPGLRREAHRRKGVAAGAVWQAESR